MKNSIKLSDFTFKFSGHGHYEVTYTSPVTKKSSKRTINDMRLIDNTKNSNKPKLKDLMELKRVCKLLII